MDVDMASLDLAKLRNDALFGAGQPADATKLQVQRVPKGSAGLLQLDCFIVSKRSPSNIHCRYSPRKELGNRAEYRGCEGGGHECG